MQYDILDTYMDRVTLADPNEFKIIKQMYFSNWEPTNNTEDSLETLDRQQSRERSNSKSAR